MHGVYLRKKDLYTLSSEPPEHRHDTLISKKDAPLTDQLIICRVDIQQTWSSVSTRICTHTFSVAHAEAHTHTHTLGPIDDSLIARLVKKHMEAKIRGSIRASFVMDIRKRKGNQSQALLLTEHQNNPCYLGQQSDTKYTKSTSPARRAKAN